MHPLPGPRGACHVCSRGRWSPPWAGPPPPPPPPRLLTLSPRLCAESADGRKPILHPRDRDPKEQPRGQETSVYWVSRPHWRSCAGSGRCHSPNPARAPGAPAEPQGCLARPWAAPRNPADAEGRARRAPAVAVAVTAAAAQESARVSMELRAAADDDGDAGGVGVGWAFPLRSSGGLPRTPPPRLP